MEHRILVTVAVLLSLLCAGPAAARDFISVMSAGDQYTIVDTMVLARSGRTPLTVYTAGFHADVGQADTYDFGPQGWPTDYVKVWYLLGFTRMTPYQISAPVDGQWYDLPSFGPSCTSSRIMFTYLDGIEEPRGGSMPATRLAATPNPFRDLTVLRFELTPPAGCRIDVLDQAGRVVRTLASGRSAPGTHNLCWDGRNQLGRRLPAGVYFARLTTDARPLLVPLVLTR